MTSRLSPQLGWTVLAGAVAACVIAIMFVFYVRPGAVHTTSGTASTVSDEFVLRSGANIGWYSASPDGSFHAKVSPSTAAGIPITVTEALPASHGLYPVLATVSTADASDMHSVFGIADANGAFKSIDSKGRFKEGLTADGPVVAYAAFIPAVGAAATGPLALNATLATSTGSWEVRLVDLSATNPEAVSIGQGSDPRFLPDGSILAFGNEGVVRIDPKTKARTVVVAHAAGTVGTYAVSPDLAHFALSDVPLGAMTTVYAFSPERGATVAGTIDAPLAAIGFVSNDELAGAYIASTTLQFYGISPNVTLERSAPLSDASSNTP